MAESFSPIKTKIKTDDNIVIFMQLCEMVLTLSLTQTIATLSKIHDPLHTDFIA